MTRRAVWAVVGALLFTSLAVVAPASALEVTLADADALKFNRSTQGQNIVGTGIATGDIVLYKGVGNFGGVVIDAAVTVKAVSAGNSVTFDNPGSATTTGNYLDNFMINTSGANYASITVSIEFFQANTYTGAGTGIPLLLHNVKITSIDLDSSGTNGFQYSDFSGFQAYQLMNPTNLAVQALPAAGGLPARVRFIATKTGARSSVPEDQVLVRYDALQKLTVTFGNAAAAATSTTNYFGLIFGGWPGPGNPVEYSNSYNALPTSTDTTQYVKANTAATIPLSSFGNYSDLDENPFTQVRISTAPTGLKYSADGSTFTQVSNDQVVTVEDINLGRLQYNGTVPATVKFYVQDGLDYSATENTLTLAAASNTQVITFNNPGTKSVSATAFASAATASSGLPVTLTSLTPGVCTVSGLTITAVAAGTCQIVATQSGSSSYGAANPVTQTFTVIAGGSSLKSQTITFSNPANTTTATSAVASGATASSGLAVTLTSKTPTVCGVSGLSITIRAAGTCTIEATQPGDGTWAAASPVTRSFSITAPAGGTLAARTDAATGITSSSATLNSTLTTATGTNKMQFCIASKSSDVESESKCDDKLTGSESTTSTVGSVAFSYTKTGLSSSKTYYFRIKLTNGSTKKYGDILSFKTLDPTPDIAVITLPPTAQSKVTTSGVTTETVTLAGTLTQTGAATSTNTYFCYKQTENPSVSNSALQSCDKTVNGLTNQANSTAGRTETVTAAGWQHGKTYFLQAYASKYGSTSTKYYGNLRKYVAGAPVANTSAATETATTSAKLNGTVDPTGLSTTAWFCLSTSNTETRTSGGIRYGVLSDCTTRTPDISVGLTSGVVQAGVTGLLPLTTYYFQVVARSSVGTNYGRILSFTTPTAPAIVTTAPATAVLGTTARLQGSVTPQGSTETPQFKYSTTLSGGSLGGSIDTVSATPSSVSGTTSRSIYADIRGLTPGQTYYFQAISGSVSGSILSFVTGAPVAVTGAATNVDTVSATLNGMVKAQGGTAYNYFCLGTSSTVTSGELQGCTEETATVSTSTGYSPTPISLTKTGLTQGTTYYFQARAKSGTDASLVAYGGVYSFLTVLPPTAVTESTTAGTDTAALKGNVTANGDTSTVYFCLGTSGGSLDGVLDVCVSNGFLASNRVSVAPNASGLSDSLTVSGLNPGTRYYTQIVAENNVGTAYGAIDSFVTGAAAPVVTTTTVSVEASSATVNGTVNAGGETATVSFYLSETNTVDGSGMLSGTLTDTPTSTPATGVVTVAKSGTTTASLATGHTYYYQIFATNSAGTSYGNVRSFIFGAPSATTSAVKIETATTVTLQGSAAANGDTTTVTFCLLQVDSSTVDADGVLTAVGTTCIAPTASTASLTPAASASETATVSGLLALTQYRYQVKALNGRGTAYGDVVTFWTGMPVAVTLAQADTLTATTAYITGTVNANGTDPLNATDVWFSYSTESTTVDGALTSSTDLLLSDTATGTTAQTFGTLLTDLTPSTTYYFQIVGVNGTLGTAYGAVKSFMTLPNASTDGALALDTTATLNGSASQALTIPVFCYALAPTGAGGFGNNCATSGAKSETATGTFAAYTANVTGLIPQSTYIVQLMGTVGGTWYKGETVTMTTTAPGAPGATTTAASGVGYTTATVNGTVNANYDTATISFCIGSSNATDGNGAMLTCDLTATSDTVTGHVDTNATANLTGLSQTTMYYFQVIAVNSSGQTVYGIPLSFTTLTTPAPSNNNRGGGGGTPAATTPTVKKLEAPTKTLPKKGVKTDTSVQTTEKKSVEAKLEPVVAKVLAPASTTPSTPSSGGTTTTPAPTVTLENVTVLPEIKEQVAKQVKLEETTAGVKVTPVNGYTGKLVVPVITVANNEEVEVLTEIVVNPEPAPSGQSTPQALKKTKLEWAPSTSQVVEYIVEVNGQEVCKTTGTSCEVGATVGPKTDVQVTAIGNDQTISEETDLKYKALQFIAAAKVQFDESSSKLKPAAKKVLQEVAKVIIEAGFSTIAIEGHTDSQGGTKNATPLSKARAVSTQKYLDSLLPEKLQVRLAASGLSKPAASNATAAGQAKNRRAEVLVK